jgi:hypothetical protein
MHMHIHMHMHMHMYMYMYMHVCVCVRTHTHIHVVKSPGAAHLCAIAHTHDIGEHVCIDCAYMYTCM